MTVTSPQVERTQETPIDATVFVMGMGPRLAAGTPLVIELAGLPHKAARRCMWPSRSRRPSCARPCGSSSSRVSSKPPARAGARCRSVARRASPRWRRSSGAPRGAHRRGSLHCATVRAHCPARTRLRWARPRRRHDAGWAGRRRVNADFDRLTLTDVSRNFGRRRALSHVSFSCATGDMSGCSATTAPASRPCSRFSRPCSVQARRRALRHTHRSGRRRRRTRATGAARARAAALPRAHRGREPALLRSAVRPL